MIGRELEHFIFELSTHPNGNHVLQSYLMTFKASNMPHEQNMEGSDELAIYTNFIFNACMAYCDSIGTDKHGCCVMQRCLEKGLKS